MNFKKISVQAKINFTFIITLLAVILCSYYIYLDKRGLEELNTWIARQYMVQEQINSITFLVKNNQIRELKDTSFTSASDEKANNVESQIFKCLDSIKVLTTGDYEQQLNLDSVRASFSKSFALIKNIELRPPPKEMRPPKEGFIPQRRSSSFPNLSPPPQFDNSSVNRGQLDEFMLMERNLELLNKISSSEDLLLHQRLNEFEKIKIASYVKFSLLICMFIIVLIITYRMIRRDLKLRIKIQKELREKTEELKIINAHKDRLLSVIAHDLRSPFQPILGLSEIMMSDAKELTAEEIELYGTQLNTIGNGIYSLLETLLDWSRVKTGKTNFNPTEVCLKEKVADVFVNLDLNAKNKNIILNNMVGDKLKVYAEENMLMSILQNLVANAIKFTNEFGEIKVDAKEETKNIIVSVADNGVGIKKEDIEKLFNMEQQFSTKGTKSEYGSGLGLLLCKDFVEKNNGKIWVESELGKGSTFYFSLPKCV